MIDLATTGIRVFVPEKAPDKVLVNIKKYKQKTGHVTLIGGELQECREVLLAIVKPHSSVVKKGKHINVEMRELKDNKNGRSISFSFYTERDEVTPDEVADLIIESLTDPVEGIVENRVEGVEQAYHSNASKEVEDGMFAGVIKSRKKQPIPVEVGVEEEEESPI